MRNLFTRNRLLSLISAPVIWAVHFTICYVMVSLACAGGGSATIVNSGIAIATATAFALLAWIAVLNVRKWQRARHAGDGDAGIDVFFAVNSILLSALSAVALVWVAMPIAMLPPCAA